ncbi:hypothetical protein ZOSMA_50G00240 [Zostera marina]|uniref:Regulatory protein RecX n=1 Tax=Zostera marina TaxID=29655 RepID=A0A0K9P097_ZOSMR|nr:hypothetical protein ZOSMA_50G00240 [Zostera marina]
MLRLTTVIQIQNMQSQALTWAKRRFICFVGYVRGGTHVRSNLRSRAASGEIRFASNYHSSDYSGYEYKKPPISEQPYLTNQFTLDKIKYSDFDVKEEIDPKILNDSRIRQNVYNTAIKFLAARAFPASALRHKLIDKKFPVKITDIVINDLQSRGLLNDSHYAESFSHSRWLSLSWGPRKIKRALVQKGISEDDASKAACQMETCLFRTLIPLIEKVFENGVKNMKKMLLMEKEQGQKKEMLSKSIVCHRCNGYFIYRNEVGLSHRHAMSSRGRAEKNKSIPAPEKQVHKIKQADINSTNA